MITRHPFRSLGLVLGVAVVFFVLSASGQSDGFWKSGPSWLGAIGWFGFLICLLAFVVLAAYLAIAKVLRRHRARLTA
jgi:hypothetical protein